MVLLWFRGSAQIHSAVQSSRCSVFFHQSCAQDPTLPLALWRRYEGAARVFLYLNIIKRVRVSEFARPKGGAVATHLQNARVRDAVRACRVSKRQDQSRVRTRPLRAPRSYYIFTAVQQTILNLCGKMSICCALSSSAVRVCDGLSTVVRACECKKKKAAQPFAKSPVLFGMESWRIPRKP